MFVRNVLVYAVIVALSCVALNVGGFLVDVTTPHGAQILGYFTSTPF